MVKKTTRGDRSPRIEQVIFIDLETTDLIYEIDQIMPHILTFSAMDH